MNTRRIHPVTAALVVLGLGVNTALAGEARQAIEEITVNGAHAAAEYRERQARFAAEMVAYAETCGSAVPGAVAGPADAGDQRRDRSRSRTSRNPGLAQPLVRSGFAKGSAGNLLSLRLIRCPQPALECDAGQGREADWGPEVFPGIVVNTDRTTDRVPIFSKPAKAPTKRSARPWGCSAGRPSRKTTLPFSIVMWMVELKRSPSRGDQPHL